jgi:hypothetical protein
MHGRARLRQIHAPPIGKLPLTASFDLQNGAATEAVLGAWLDAYSAGVSTWDAEDIAKVIERRSRPTYEKRLVVFNATRRPESPRDRPEKLGCVSR